MKKVIKILLFVILTLFFMQTIVNANSVTSFNMDIYIDNNGTANVKEVWNGNWSKNTEIYHSYKNLGNSTISNLTVSNNGTPYTNIGKWNIDASFDSKANKCGINKISDGIELCWGISKYGSNTYTVNYTITNFVSNLTDCQMAYWNLLPPSSDKIKSAYIKIHSDFIYSDNLDVWGFGNYGGTCYVYDGYIEMASDGALDSNEYMTILIKFPTKTFNTTNNLNNDFDYYLDMAEQGATKYKDKEFNFDFISIIFFFVFIFFNIFGISRLVPKSTFNFGVTR